MIKSYLLGSVLMLTVLLSPGQDTRTQEQQPTRLSSREEIPRLAWYSVPASEISEQRYRELKEAGITITFSFFSSQKDAERSLAMAERVGVKVLLSCPELKTDPEATARKFMKHPALAGYFLRDEPSRSEFEELGKWMRRIQSVDKDHFCYVNALPIYAENWQFEYPKEPDFAVATTYTDYLTAFIQHIPAPFISYDAYCIIGDSLRANYYENLEVVAKASQKVNKDFWAFALTTGSSEPVNFPPPTLAELRFQVYSILAYGAKGVQYFTYWTPPVNETPWDFHLGPIGLDGKRTVTYDRLKKINEEVSKLSGVFAGGKVLSVRHIGKTIPKATTRLEDLPPGIKALEMYGAEALVSTIQNGDHTYTVIVNRSFKKEISLTALGDEGLQKVLKDGMIVPAGWYSSHLTIDAGDIAIFRYPTTKLK
ncbi:MAG: hypothetical protein KF746_20035 [Chitinophagaceae bacterium]|nr:hypothetical protein [Chitinophagaceae bacterium]